MNLYEYTSSRPTFFADPWGLVTYAFQDITKIPWSDHDLVTPASGIKSPLGLTLPTKLTTSCVCFCCDVKNNKYRFDCTVTFDVWIYLDVNRIKKDRTQDLETSYGHEQLHAQSMQNALKTTVDGWVKASKIEECQWAESDCQKVKNLERNLFAEAKKGMWSGIGHGGAGQPETGRPYPPIAGTKVADNRADKPPLTAPDNLRDLWQRARSYPIGQPRMPDPAK